MTGPANRGKYAEGKVRERLVVLSDTHSNFCFNRNLDAHAAGGRFAPQAGDFQAFARTDLLLAGDQKGSRNFIIEVKEVAHATRLPYKNYSSDKVARVKARDWAGTECLVLICHKLPKAKPVWRAVPQAFFYERNEATPSGSWDLSSFPIVDHKVAIDTFLGFLPNTA